jgi:hypothetical protein
VSSPAHGRETSAPGADQCRRPWPPRTHRGRVYTEVFSSGYRGRLLHFPLLFFWQAVRPSSHGCRWIAYSLLGRAPVISHFSRPPFRVAVSAGQGPVSYHRRGFFKALQAVRGPASAPQPSCSQSRQPNRAVTAVAASQVHRPAAGIFGQRHPGRVPGGCQHIQGAAALITWGGAFHRHEGAADSEQIWAVGR